MILAQCQNCRSDSIANVVKNARRIAEQGAKEIVLTGVNLGDFGKRQSQNGNESFFDLVKALDEVDGIERFRISSIEPNLLKDEIIEFVSQSKRFVPHFHIPLQSGSNKILKTMRRRYIRELYAERVAKIKSLMPHCCIGVDVIVGFPGETEEDFLETFAFLNQLDVSYLHVFTYSERADTLAKDMANPVPMAIRKKRNKMLRILSTKKLRNFYEQHLGQTRTVLFEADNKDGYMRGFTDNYIKVRIPFEEYNINQLIEVTLIRIAPDGSVEILNEKDAVSLTL